MLHSNLLELCISTLVETNYILLLNFEDSKTLNVVITLKTVVADKVTFTESEYIHIGFASSTIQAMYIHIFTSPPRGSRYTSK